MSGHSKWSKVKHQKATTDVVKGQAFTKASRAITMSVREGGGITDPVSNFKLRLAVEQARAVNMPKDTIERAIEKGKGASGESLQSAVYEGYGPGGVAILVETATDNSVRTGAQVKHEFERHGGSLSSPGAVSFQFKRAVVFRIPKDGKSFDDVFTRAVESGADDVTEGESSFDVYAYNTSESTMKVNLQKAGLAISATEFVMKPITNVALSDKDSEALRNLVRALEELDDVSKIYTNSQE